MRNKEIKNKKLIFDFPQICSPIAEVWPHCGGNYDHVVLKISSTVTGESFGMIGI